MKAIAIAPAAVAGMLTLLPPLPAAAACSSHVQVNGKCVSRATIAQLEATYGTRAQPGRYWYDARSGLLGRIGEPPLGVIAPNLDLPGPLARAASGGRTKVLVNGRALHPIEVQQLSRLGPVRPGRYWLDASGNVGLEGSPQPFANLFAAIQRARGGSRDNFYRNDILGTTTNSDGRCSYVSTDSGTVMTGNCD